jgi:hypothetical protein
MAIRAILISNHIGDPPVVQEAHAILVNKELISSVNRLNRSHHRCYSQATSQPHPLAGVPRPETSGVRESNPHQRSS